MDWLLIVIFSLLLLEVPIGLRIFFLHRKIARLTRLERRLSLQRSTERRQFAFKSTFYTYGRQEINNNRINKFVNLIEVRGKYP